VAGRRFPAPHGLRARRPGRALRLGRIPALQPEARFYFLVDAEDGWSLVKPVTGAPIFKPGENSAVYLKTNYPLQSSYRAETTYVAGEFYWQVQRGQKTFNRDFASGSALLSQEEAPNEITWSSGSKLDGDLVAKAFKLEGKKDLFKRSKTPNR
jgi:hypothetical protein